MSLLSWIDERFPATKFVKEHLTEYYAPKNFNFWYFFGSLALFVLVMQFITGIFLTMHYKPDADLAFASVEYIMRDVDWGWLIRLYVCLMAEAFMGYLLPWGQMSYWGAQVIISLFGAIPVVGEGLALWIRGDFVVADATLNRFFAFHVIALPIVLLALVAAHIVALHEVGSNNPDGVEIKATKNDQGRPVDGVPFHPYYSVKDLLGLTVFLFVFFLVLFYAPEMGGWFLEKDNFVPANPLSTPEHIVPLWYFTPFYAILRAVPSIAGSAYPGVLAMGAAIVVLFFLPWLDRSPVRSIRYRGPLFKTALTIFIISFLSLGFLGTQPATGINTLLARLFTLLYFAFFFFMPIYTSIDKDKPVPERVTDS